MTIKKYIMVCSVDTYITLIDDAISCSSKSWSWSWRLEFWIQAWI